MTKSFDRKICREKKTSFSTTGINEREYLFIFVQKFFQFPATHFPGYSKRKAFNNHFLSQILFSEKYQAARHRLYSPQKNRSRFLRCLIVT